MSVLFERKNLESFLELSRVKYKTSTKKKIASITINNVYNTHNFSKYEQEICEQGTCEQRIYVKLMIGEFYRSEIPCLETYSLKAMYFQGESE